MSQMKKISSVAAVSFLAVACAASLGAVGVSCGSFSSGPTTGGSTGGATGGSDLGGATGTGLGGDNGLGGATDLGGSTGTAGTTGGAGARGTGGSTGTAGTTGATGLGGSTGTGGATTVAGGPCDILAAAGNTCAAAHSTTRALYGSYTGPLYQVCRGAFRVAAPPLVLPACTGTTMDIGVVAGGYADAAAQDTFCAGAACTIFVIYDQSPNKNDLWPAPPGGHGGACNPANATALKTTANGHSVYGVSIATGMGYRSGCTNCVVKVPKNTAVGDAPETEYMVTSQNNKQPGLMEGCCFDYGNAETSANDDGNGTMEAVYFGGGVSWGTGFPGGHNNGPWVMADLENGLYAGWSTATTDQSIPTNTPIRLPFITGVIVGDTREKNANRGRFAIYGGDATVAGPLTTLYDGVRPVKTGYVPMAKQGSIILGIGGDDSNTGTGQWFEGVMASGAATLATVNAVQANIAAARYGK
jgi:hypothetical protein